MLLEFGVGGEGIGFHDFCWMDACCHVAWGNRGKRDHSGMKMWVVVGIGPALRSCSLLQEFARDLGRLVVPTLPRRILDTVPTRLPRDIPLVRNRFLHRFRHNIFRRWCRWLRRLATRAALPLPKFGLPFVPRPRCGCCWRWLPRL